MLRTPGLLIIILCIFFHHAFAQKEESKLKKELSSKTTEVTQKKNVKIGVASYYANKFEGRQTTNGEIYRKEKFTAACNQLPFNTWIKVTNLRNGRSVIVRVNDRLNSHNKRLVDLSRSAAQKLGIIGRGIAKVKVEELHNYSLNQ